jgi:hypothetical protein
VGGNDAAVDHHPSRPRGAPDLTEIDVMRSALGTKFKNFAARKIAGKFYRNRTFRKRVLPSDLRKGISGSDAHRMRGTTYKIQLDMLNHLDTTERKASAALEQGGPHAATSTRTASSRQQDLCQS